MANVDKFVSFFITQAEDAKLEQKKVDLAPMSELFKSGDVTLAYTHSVLPELGMVVLRFYKSKTPRLKVQKEMVLIAKNAGSVYGPDFLQWGCTWENYKQSPLHSSPSYLMPMYYLPMDDPKYDYVTCSGVKCNIYDIITNAHQSNHSLPVLVYDPYPPIGLYKNMISYLSENRDNEELLMQPKISYADWNPIELEYDSENPNKISSTIYDTLQTEKRCILQGPPGSGKSYTIAQIVQRYLDAGKSVCVTTMANKGLIELIRQNPLESSLKGGHIHKTHLSADEKRIVPTLLPASKELYGIPGDLICSTNYELSYAFNLERREKYGYPHYDLIVIEEASQAFLTTILAFKSLGDHCLIVGDPMQLPPIVSSSDNPKFRTWNLSSQIEGLKTLVLGSDIKSFRIITSFRLTQKSADLTKIFYGENFRSVRENLVDFSSASSNLFPAEGGVLYCVTEDTESSIYSESADKIIRQVVEAFSTKFLNKSLAIVAPFNYTVRELQKRYIKEDIEADITIETIDRVQGMTVDYTILYLPPRYPGFALTENRFNVATSRSRSTTLIISDAPIETYPKISNLVLKFLSSSDRFSQSLSTSSSPVQPISEPEIHHIEVKPIGVKTVGYIDLSQFERKKTEIKADKKNYYIIDTNVFVNCPDIISKIGKEYPIILSVKVMDELDKMKVKLDEQGKLNAEKALRAINNEKVHQILYELSDVSLLPPEFDKRSPDNMILSVALKYKDENPIMLTSDNGLQVKSKSMGISTISLRNFLKR